MQLRPDTMKKTTPHKMSAELFAIPLGENKFIIYAPLRKVAFIGDATLVKFLADWKEQRPKVLDRSQSDFIALLRKVGIVDGGPEPQPLTEFEGPPEPVAVTLFLTTECNLRCTYCYANAGDARARSMPLNVAKSGINYIIMNAVRHKSPRVDIGFHGGGEPSVNWKVLTDGTNFAKDLAAEHGIDVRTSLTTNGVLPKAKLDWIVANIDYVSLSFDGLPDVHDRNRPTAGRRKSSNYVMQTMRRFDSEGFPYSIRMTVTADQIKWLSSSVEFICNHFQPLRIQVEPVYQMGRWISKPSAETSAFIDAYRKAQICARKFGHEIFFSGARANVLTNHFCGVSQDNFCISPDGNVSACFEAFSEQVPHADRFFYGQFEDDTYLFNLDILNKLRATSIEHRTYCKKCFAKWSCGGDCFYKAICVSDSSEFSGTDRCHIIQELTKDQILDKIFDAGGCIWYEPSSGVPSNSRLENCDD